MVMNQRDILLGENTRIHASFEEGQNFVLNIDPANIVNYSRWGHDLIIELASGASVRVDDFFLRGSGFHQLSLDSAAGRQVVDFSDTFTQGMDGIDDAQLRLDHASQAGSVDSLRNLLMGGGAILGAVAVGIAAGGATGHDITTDSLSPFPVSTPPTIFLIDGRIKEEGRGYISGVHSKDTKPHLTGRATAGSTLILRLDGAEIAQIVVGNDGTWSHHFPDDLGEGIYKLHVSQRDGFGRVSEAEFEFTIDTTPPAAPHLVKIESDVHPVGEVTSGPSNDETPKFSGTAEAFAEINIYAEIDGEKQLYGSGFADSDGNWSVEMNKSLPEGKTTITITATDRAGNESEYSTERELEIDVTPPKAVEEGDVAAYADPENLATLITDGKTTEQKFSFKGKVVAGDAVKIVIYNNGEAIGETTDIDADGNWVFTFKDGLSPGYYNFSFEVHDAAGNRASRAGYNYSINVENADANMLSSLLTPPDVFSDAGEEASIYADSAYHHSNPPLDDSLPAIL